MITLPQLIACIQREIRMRHRVYPRFVRSGRMTQMDMDHEIACMPAALERLQGPDLQPDLFPVATEKE